MFALKKMQSELVVKGHEPDYPQFLNWMQRSDATFTFPLAVVLRYREFEPPERQLLQAADDYIQFFLSRLKSIELALSDGRQFICADRFTVADSAIHYPLYLGELIGLDYKYKPLTAAYFQRLKKRPAFEQSLQAQQHLKPFI